MKAAEALYVDHDLTTVRELVDRVTYKGGWSLTPYNNPYEGLYLQIRVVTQDASTPSHETTELRINTPIPNVALDNEHAFYRWLFWRLRQIEIHECLEFYKIDGEHFHDPHDIIEP